MKYLAIKTATILFSVFYFASCATTVENKAQCKKCSRNVVLNYSLDQSGKSKIVGGCKVRFEHQASGQMFEFSFSELRGSFFADIPSGKYIGSGYKCVGTKAGYGPSEWLNFDVQPNKVNFIGEFYFTNRFENGRHYLSSSLSAPCCIASLNQAYQELSPAEKDSFTDMRSGKIITPGMLKGSDNKLRLSAQIQESLSTEIKDRINKCIKDELEANMNAIGFFEFRCGDPKPGKDNCKKAVKVLGEHTGSESLDRCLSEI